MDQSALREAIFEASLDALVIVDEQGTIVDANAAIETLLGTPVSGLIGRSVDVLVPSRFDHHAAERERYALHPASRPMGRGVALFARHCDGRDIPVDISLNPIVAGGRRFVAAAIRDLRGRSYGPETIRVQAVALRSAANGVVITDASGLITWVNPALCAMTGYAASELLGQHTRIFKSGEHEPHFYRDLWTTITRGATWSGTIVNRRKDGSKYYEEQTIAPVVDEHGAVTHFIAIKQDVTRQYILQEQLTRANQELATRLSEIESLNRQLSEMAVRDSLTGLHNRRYFDEQVARMAGLETAGVAVIDVDRFKTINDILGHSAGDLALQVLAAVLKGAAEPGTIVCRVGGDEFLVIVPSITEEHLRRKAELWRTAFSERCEAARAGLEVRPSISIGLAMRRDQETQLSDTLARADAALYAAKDGGRNRAVMAE